MHPEKLYDFAFVTGLQGWPAGPGALRPFIYPPSALLAFMPFSLLPYWTGYGLWVAATGALFLLAGLKARTPWWFVVLPTVAFVAYCGQVTFLIGGLCLAALSLRGRPVLAGIAFGLAAAIKPQLLILVPVALAAEARWRTLAAAGATCATLCAVSVMIWGLQPWFAWLNALIRFQHVIFESPSLMKTAVTPYAVLRSWRLDGRWAMLLAPAALSAVWLAFRRGAALPDRVIVLFGATLAVSQYAMNYELALFAPAVAAYLARTEDRPWLGYVAAALLYTFGPAPVGLVAVLALPAIRVVAPRLSLSRRMAIPEAAEGGTVKPAEQ
ncbi:MAG TPA: glycosyltransferase family 87 protein [Caulobacteraceae bacterium]